MKNVESNRRFDVTKIASKVVLATTAAVAAWSFAPGREDNHLTPASEQQQVNPAKTTEGGVAGVSPIVVETATIMPSATAVKEAPTEVPTEAAAEIPTATIEAKPTQEQAKQEEIGSFEINGKKVTVINVTEIPDRNDPARKIVAITCIPSQDFTGDISSGKWTLSLGTDFGQFPALLLPLHIDYGPEVKDGKLIPGPRLGKIIEASIPADINTYSLLITHDTGTVQDASGGVGAASSYSIPLRTESLSPDGK